MKKKLKISATSEGVQKATNALIRLGFETKSNFAESKLISRNVVTNFFRGREIQVDSFKKICRELTLDWEEIAELTVKESSEVNSEQKHFSAEPENQSASFEEKPNSAQEALQLYVEPPITQEHLKLVRRINPDDNIPPSSLLKPAPSVTEDFSCDAYICYVNREPDSMWVRDTLVPKLKEAGIGFAVSGEGIPGVPKIVNIEQGIRQAKRTIIVLSDAYLADYMAEFENTVGQTMGINEGTYRLLPVKMTAVDSNRLPTRLSMLTTLDLSSHPRRAEEFQRLVQALKSPLPRMGR